MSEWKGRERRKQTIQLCPVCQGRGVLAYNFYHTHNESVSASLADVQCKRCWGAGTIDCQVVIDKGPKLVPEKVMEIAQAVLKKYFNDESSQAKGALIAGHICNAFRVENLTEDSLDDFLSIAYKDYQFGHFGRSHIEGRKNLSKVIAERFGITHFELKTQDYEMPKATTAKVIKIEGQIQKPSQEEIAEQLYLHSTVMPLPTEWSELGMKTKEKWRRAAWYVVKQFGNSYNGGSGVRGILDLERGQAGQAKNVRHDMPAPPLLGGTEQREQT